ncbi:hypothetical protein OKW43_008543 [Paraburkholderia sp. WC7.3g]|uniref:hypothetical protein n=1 Tax=Paraburkholderia sp. WC7.3g TaxID=2991070 RepID=UPI003D232EB6
MATTASPGLEHRSGDELLMRILMRDARHAEERKLLLGVERDDARCAKAEKLNSRGGCKQIDGPPDRLEIELLARPVETRDGVVENLGCDGLRRIGSAKCTRSVFRWR